MLKYPKLAAFPHSTWYCTSYKMQVKFIVEGSEQDLLKVKPHLFLVRIRLTFLFTKIHDVTTSTILLPHHPIFQQQVYTLHQQ